MISLSCIACTRSFTDRDMDIYEKIHKYYSKMESYSTDLDMTVFSNKTQNRYFVSQKVKVPDKFYMRLTDKDGTFSVTTITNNGITKALADGADYSLSVPSDDYLNMLFVNNFFKAYYASESTALCVDTSFSESKKTILDVFLDDKNLSIKKASLSIDNDELAPDTLTLYGEGDKVLLKATFSNFKYNDKTNESVFNTD